MAIEVENWMRQAEEDYSSAGYNFRGGKYYLVAFLCQQTLEKALKALLIKKTDDFPRVHDLVALSRMASCPKEIIDKCKIINPYYIETRYPDFLDKIPAESFTEEEMNELLKLTEEVLKWIRKVLA